MVNKDEYIMNFVRPRERSTTHNVHIACVSIPYPRLCATLGESLVSKSTYEVAPPGGVEEHYK